jgi:hypothetical protein
LPGCPGNAQIMTPAMLQPGASAADRFHDEGTAAADWRQRGPVRGPLTGCMRSWASNSSCALPHPSVILVFAHGPASSCFSSNAIPSRKRMVLGQRDVPLEMRAHAYPHDENGRVMLEFRHPVEISGSGPSFSAAMLQLEVTHRARAPPGKVVGIISTGVANARSAGRQRTARASFLWRSIESRCLLW